jgi:far upstream element-binding protein
MKIPDASVGLCIGRQGIVIKEMQARTRSWVQIPSQPTPGQTHRLATVSGTPEACEQVRLLIDRIVAEQSSAFLMPSGNQFGVHMGAHGPTGVHVQEQQQQQPQSAEWAAYYAAQGMQQQQIQQEQHEQYQQGQAQTNTSDASQESYYEQFFRYAYYYGEEAARSYYGAWSPPVGTPNPYGVNPAGIQSAPVSSASSHSVPS